MINKIKIYPNQNELQLENYIEFFIPHWGQQKRLTVVPECPDNARYDDLIQNGKKYIDLVDDITGCDYVALPYMWQKRDPYVEHLITLAQKNNKKIIIFFESDDAGYIDLQPHEGYIFRTSLFKHQQKPNERGLPAWSADFIKGIDYLAARDKTDIPIINFCGYINSAEKYHSAKILSQSKNVQFNLKVREKFHGHTELQQRLKNRIEYVEMMHQSDYALCARGAGNFSYRFYEALSFGKIPVFVDSDCVLPFENILNYKDFCVWIKPQDLVNIEKIIIEYHQKFTNETFKKQQIKNRTFWEEYLSPIGFLKHIKESINE
jgi:hypothetical protein